MASSKRSARTATGKSVSRRGLNDNEKRSREALRERLTGSTGAEDVRSAGDARSSSFAAGKRTVGASRVDDAIRTVPTYDEQLLQLPHDGDDFTRTDPWRVFRITSEFVEGFDVLSSVRCGVSVFGSARTPPSDPMYRKAVQTAKLLAQAGFEVLTGGGPGIMEAANRGAQLGGGRSVGLNIELPFEQEGNRFADTTINFRYFFVRKTMFIKYSIAFIIFPGGFGTLDEAFEALTLIQTGKIYRFPVIFVGTRYWGGLLRWMKQRLLADKMIGPAEMDLMVVTDSPRAALEVVRAATDAPRKRR